MSESLQEKLFRLETDVDNIREVIGMIANSGRPDAEELITAIREFRIFKENLVERTMIELSRTANE